MTKCASCVTYYVDVDAFFGRRLVAFLLPFRFSSPLSTSSNIGSTSYEIGKAQRSGSKHPVRLPLCRSRRGRLLLTLPCERGPLRRPRGGFGGGLGFNRQRGGSDRNRNVIESIETETFTQTRRQTQARGPAWVLGPADRSSIEAKIPNQVGNRSDRSATYPAEGRLDMHVYQSLGGTTCTPLLVPRRRTYSLHCSTFHQSFVKCSFRRKGKA